MNTATDAGKGKEAMALLTIENDGQQIIATNFWQTEQAKQGAFYLSTNAGAFRLLIPVRHRDMVTEMQNAQDVIISRGPWPDAGQADAIEILFNDRSDAPFAIHLGVAQLDRLPAREDRGRTLTFTAWVWQGGKPVCAYRSECYFRMVSEIPCLRGWGEE